MDDHARPLQRLAVTPASPKHTTHLMLGHSTEAGPWCCSLTVVAECSFARPRAATRAPAHAVLIGHNMNPPCLLDLFIQSLLAANFTGLNLRLGHLLHSLAEQSTCCRPHVCSPCLFSRPHVYSPNCPTSTRMTMRGVRHPCLQPPTAPSCPEIPAVNFFSRCSHRVSIQSCWSLS